ncbi:MAG: VWA domain-containing protein [Polyangiales bacterium]
MARMVQGAKAERLAWWGVLLVRVGLGAYACTASPAYAACEDETLCSFKKPNVLLVLDYSSSMSGSEQAPAFFPPGQTVSTRWTAELDAANWILRYDKGFFADNTRIALSRFAHDPLPLEPGTTIGTDRSFPRITDGFALDVPFDGSDGEYLQCKSSGVEAALEVLRKAPPPPVGVSFDRDSIMLTWTRGALRSAHSLIESTRARHRAETGESTRDYQVVLMTDGDWTCADTVGQGCDENPAPEAGKLLADGVPVYVIAFGDAAMQPSLNEVALQGGTGKAIDAQSPQGIVDALSRVLDDIRDSVIVPTCTQKLPRVLITMDASTSMLEGSQPGATKWDKARFALSGNPAAPKPTDPGYVEPVLTHTVSLNGRDVAIEDLVHLGMVAFAGAEQQQLMFGFGPCMRDNIAWAMDPATSCVAPGCSDPYGGGPLSWTFKDSDSDRDPHFVRTTHSYMPACLGDAAAGGCGGTLPTTFTGQGLDFARQTIRNYKTNSAPFSQTDQTRYVNVLVTDGQTSEGSSDVQAALEGLVADGVDTYVIGFGSEGELDSAQLEQYAIWGNTRQAITVDPSQPDSAAALADALAAVVTSLGLDSCCVLNQCATEPEPADPNAVCGDGKVEGDELCDDGPENASYGHCSARCDGLHLFCGDARIDADEQCDDGNTRDHDGCSKDCVLTPDDADAGPNGAAGSGSRVGAVPPGTRVNRPPTTPAAPQPAIPPPPSAADGGMVVGVLDAGPGDSASQVAGCSCRVAEPGESRLAPLLGLGVLGLLALRVRRRRRV